jgi:hypothetical protein
MVSTNFVVALWMYINVTKTKPYGEEPQLNWWVGKSDNELAQADRSCIIHDGGGGCVD